jgi:hypothetical protein
MKYIPMSQRISAMVLISAILVLSGCATVETTAYRTLGSTSSLVDNAMKAWGDYVRAGLATPTDQQTCRGLYIRYQAGMKVAKTAVLSYKAGLEKDDTTLNTALSTATASASDLIAFVRYFTQPK